MGILILADFRPMGISFHAMVVFGLGKDLFFAEKPFFSGLKFEWNLSVNT